MKLLYLCDRQRHLVCLPFSIKNLHAMAEQLGIKRCWFHRDHYDIPKTRKAEIMKRCFVTTTRVIARIARKEKLPENERTMDPMNTHETELNSLYELEASL